MKKEMKNMKYFKLVFILVMAMSAITATAADDLIYSSHKDREGKIELFNAQNYKGNNVSVYLYNDKAFYLDSIEYDCVRLYCNNHRLSFIQYSPYYDEPFDESDIWRMAYFRSPDNKWLFVVLHPSFADSCDLFCKKHVYKVDMETFEVTFLNDCGFLQVNEDGFVLAEQVQWINPNECCAKSRYTVRLVFYDFDGNVTKRGKVLKDNDVSKKFKEDYLPEPEGEYLMCYELNSNHNCI